MALTTLGGEARSREQRERLSTERVRLALRTKGILAFVALVLYIIVVGIFAAGERQKLLVSVQDLERSHVVEEKLAKVNTMVAHTVLKSQEAFYAPEPRQNHESIALDIEAIQAALASLVSYYPRFAVNIDRLEADLVELRSTRGRSALVSLRTGIFDLVDHLDAFTRQVRGGRELLSAQYRLHYDAITLITLIGGLVGVIVFGGLVTLFFTRLAWDIKKLETRALDIVTGDRGEPIPVTRRDEIGNLMASVNKMQSALRAHEQQMELSRQQRFHQDKMAAVGSLAAAIAHEINNPIAAIHGVAEHMSKVKQRLCIGNGEATCEPQLILAQTRRISQITRQIAEICRPHSGESELLDVNALVTNTCNLVRYDKRFRRVQLTLDLDRQLPAVHAVADHLTQVLMNVLINAVDATETVVDRKPEIAVSTFTRDGALHVCVRDNGCGMEPEVLGRAFEESFTTKPVGKGSGLGLFICKSLIEQSGGRVALESVRGGGTTAALILPLQPLS